MSEILLKVGAGANYEDGDIIAAFSERRIACEHTQAICHKKHAPMQDQHLLENDCLTQRYLEATRQYRMERLSTSEVRKTRLSDGAEIRIIDGEPHEDFDGRMKMMHVAEFVRRRKHTEETRQHLPLFGAPGEEIWYGGRTDNSDAVLDSVWDVIESRTDMSRTDTDFQLWPFSTGEIRQFLPVRVTALTDAEAQELLKPKYQRDSNGELVLDEDNNPIVEAKRRYRLPWRNTLDDLGATESEICNRGFAIGREKEINIRRWIGQSKDQPNQGRSVIEDKA